MNNNDTDFPINSHELIRRLDEAYPHRCINPGELPEVAHRYAGKRELIDNLVREAVAHQYASPVRPSNVLSLNFPERE